MFNLDIQIFTYKIEQTAQQIPATVTLNSSAFSLSHLSGYFLTSLM